MCEHGKISYKQLTYIIILSRLMMSLTFVPFFDAPPGNQDMWISSLLSFFFQFVLFMPLIYLCDHYKNLNLIQISEKTLGTFGKIIGILYIWFFIHIDAIHIRQFGEYLTSVPYPETPITVFIISLMCFGVHTVGHGIETIGRITEIVFPLILFFVILILALVTNKVELANLLPIMEKGFLEICKGAFIIASRTTEILFLPMLYPFISNANIKYSKKSSFWVSTLLSISFSIIYIFIISVLGIKQAKNRVFPFSSIVRAISLADFIERIDAVFMGIWVLGMYVKIAIFFYLAVLGISQIFNLSDFRPIIIPVGTIIISLSILQSESIIALYEFMSYKIYTWYVLFFITFLPIIMIIISKLKGARDT